MPLLIITFQSQVTSFITDACCCCCCCVASVVSDSVWPHRRQPTRIPRPWDSPSKNTGVGCHFLLQCMKVKSESEVAQSCPTLSDPMDRSLPGYSIHGIFQTRVLEWGATAFCQWTWVCANCRRQWRTGKPGMLQSMGSQRVRHDSATEQQYIIISFMNFPPHK